MLWIVFGMILYWRNGMELNSYIWDNVSTDVCCVLSIDAYVVTEIFELHWWSKSHRLRYQMVRSWRGSSCTLWHMRCTTWVVLNLPWSFLLDSLVILDQVLVFGRTYLIRVFQKTLIVEYFGCVDPCEIYVIVLLLRFVEIE